MERTELLKIEKTLVDAKVEDKVYLNDLDTMAYAYEGIEGYWYSDNFNAYWIKDPYDYEVDEDGIISMPNAVWLYQK